MPSKKCIICGKAEDKLPLSYVCNSCREILLARRDAYIKKKLIKERRSLMER